MQPDFGKISQNAIWEKVFNMENNDKSVEKLDRIIDLLEDLLILIGRSAGILVQHSFM